jgi:uncharacterized membrane protein
LSFGDIALMTQDDVNLQEWSDPANWSDGLFGLFRAYHSKRDSRVFVPKRPLRVAGDRPASYPAFSLRGCTINFGHRRGMLTMVILGLIPLVALFTVLTLTVRGH